MASTATAETTIRRVTLPREVSALLDRKAKAENTTFSGAFLSIVENHMDDEEDNLDDAEKERLFNIIMERRAERLRTGAKTIPIEEIMRKYGVVPDRV